MFDVNQHLINRKASAVVAPFLFVKQGTTDDEVATAGANDVVLGVGPDYSVAQNEAIPVTVGGGTQLELGATVVAGDRLKSDAAGKGEPIATSGTTIQQIAVIALRNGVSGDVIPVLVVHSSERPALV